MKRSFLKIIDGGMTSGWFAFEQVGKAYYLRIRRTIFVFNGIK